MILIQLVKLSEFLIKKYNIDNKSYLKKFKMYDKFVIFLELENFFMILLFVFLKGNFVSVNKINNDILFIIVNNNYY